MFSVFLSWDDTFYHQGKRPFQEDMRWRSVSLCYVKVSAYMAGQDVLEWLGQCCTTQGRRFYSTVGSCSPRRHSTPLGLLNNRFSVRTILYTQCLVIGPTWVGSVSESGLVSDLDQLVNTSLFGPTWVGPVSETGLVSDLDQLVNITLFGPTWVGPVSETGLVSDLDQLVNITLFGPTWVGPVSETGLVSDLDQLVNVPLFGPTCVGLVSYIALVWSGLCMASLFEVPLFVPTQHKF
ncbi:hypothetical protein J6590_015425 [Homalodisca vitripennis]|nr:hypothetical protein J6590_015425 [Homalodisca vitripennis]